jgi:hypothetical protein
MIESRMQVIHIKHMLYSLQDDGFYDPNRVKPKTHGFPSSDSLLAICGENGEKCSESVFKPQILAFFYHMIEYKSNLKRELRKAPLSSNSAIFRKINQNCEKILKAFHRKRYSHHKVISGSKLASACLLISAIQSELPRKYLLGALKGTSAAASKRTDSIALIKSYQIYKTTKRILL